MLYLVNFLITVYFMSTVVLVLLSCSNYNKLIYIRYFRYWIQVNSSTTFLQEMGLRVGGDQTTWKEEEKKKRQQKEDHQNTSKKKRQPYLCILVSMKQKIHSASNGYHKSMFSALWNKSTSSCDIFFSVLRQKTTLREIFQSQIILWERGVLQPE